MCISLSLYIYICMCIHICISETTGSRVCDSTPHSLTTRKSQQYNNNDNNDNDINTHNNNNNNDNSPCQVSSERTNNTQIIHNDKMTFE